MSDNEKDKGGEAADTSEAPDLSAVVRDAVASAMEGAEDLIQAKIDESLAPLKAQQTDWMEQIRERSDSAPKTYEKGIGAARFVRAMAFGRGDVARSVYFCEKAWDDDLSRSIAKALQAGDFTAGGALIPPEFAAEIIDLLRSRSIVRAAGARVLPMNSGTLTIRKATGSSTASYVGESTDIAKTEPTVGQIVLNSKKLAAIVPISNDLLTFSSSPAADEFVRDDLVLSIATREDQAFLRDTGLQDTPKGLRYWAQAANVSGTNGTSAANVELDFKELIDDLEGNDVKMIRPVWFMAPRSKNHLINLRDTNGNLIFPDVRGASPTLYGYPVFVSTNIPVNLAGAGNQSEVYFVDMIDAIIGEATALEIAVDASGAYMESGTLKSAFSRDETLIRAISRHDFAVRHEESVAIKTAVVWGT
ncbi:hypothetical protein LCGC14_0232150 [marine sediment metagenome]|uniref:Phage capsid-like C-terminal domain-containing protein n=1 Tax=marine sediment metagenome TaxID=412755 RepID=A0A0F9URG2_9ZZZZ